MIPTLSSETLVFATMSQPRTARTRSELRAASNSLTPTSIRACSGATPREVIFNLSTICSEETLGLFESSCARTRPTPPNPTRATFIRTASGWGVDMPFGPIFSDVIFSSGPLAWVRAIVDLGRPTLRGRGTAGPKTYLCPRDGVSRGLEGFGAHGDHRILRRRRARTSLAHASSLPEADRWRRRNRRRVRTRGALRSAVRLSAARPATVGNPRSSRGRRLHEGAGTAIDRAHPGQAEGRAVVRLLAGFVQDGLPELHGPPVRLERDR